jgi:hypothetical protein
MKTKKPSKPAKSKESPDPGRPSIAGSNRPGVSSSVDTEDAEQFIVPKADWAQKLTPDERWQRYEESASRVGAELDAMGVG